MEKIELDIKITEKDLFGFNMYHSYHSIQTWLFAGLGVVITGLALTTFNKVDITYTMLYILAGLLFVFYTPINLKTQSKLAMRTGGAISEKMKYEFSESGIKVSLSECDDKEMKDSTATSVPWALIFKIKETKKAFYIYTSPKNASILPKVQIGDKEAMLKELFRKELETYKYGG